jgi:hypothetical protein
MVRLYSCKLRSQVAVRLYGPHHGAPVLGRSCLSSATHATASLRGGIHTSARARRARSASLQRVKERKDVYTAIQCVDVCVCDCVPVAPIFFVRAF